jgi:hypothetical protein
MTPKELEDRINQAISAIGAAKLEAETAKSRANHALGKLNILAQAMDKNDRGKIKLVATGLKEENWL